MGTGWMSIPCRSAGHVSPVWLRKDQFLLELDCTLIQQNFQSPAGGIADDAHTFRGVGVSPGLFKKLSLSRVFEMEGPPKELSMHPGTENSPVLLCESIGHQFGHGDGFADQIDVF